MKIILIVLFIYSYPQAYSAEKCEPTTTFKNYVKEKKLFSSDNPKKDLELYSKAEKVSLECSYRMLTALIPEHALTWVKLSKDLGCFEDKSTCPDEMKREVFGNIDLFEQWGQWSKDNKTAAPSFSLCSEIEIEDNLEKLADQMSPVLSALKKQERMKLALDLQNLNCKDSVSVDAKDSPNYEHFKKLSAEADKMELDDFLTLWYPDKENEREDDSYFFQCQEKPWKPLTKTITIPVEAIDSEKEKLYSHEQFNKLILAHDKLMDEYIKYELQILKDLPKLTEAESQKIIKKRDEFVALTHSPDIAVAKSALRNLENIYFQIMKQVSLPIGNPKWKEYENKKNAVEKSVIKKDNYLLKYYEYEKTKFYKLKYLATECKPDVLYSWGPEKKLESMKKTMPDDTQWSKAPNPYPDEKAPLFMSMSPTATFGYGNHSVRIKIKKSTPFQIINSHVGSEGKEKEVQVRIDEYQDFTINDASVIESWSYGTPEHYDEMVRDLKRLKENKRAQLYTTGYSGVNETEGLNKLFKNPDGYATNEKVLKARLLTHINMILKGEGKIHYQKGSCRNQEQFYRTKKPTYFNPR